MRVLYYIRESFPYANCWEVRLIIVKCFGGWTRVRCTAESYWFPIGFRRFVCAVLFSYRN